jgi:hypothetical protein
MVMKKYFSVILLFVLLSCTNYKKLLFNSFETGIIFKASADSCINRKVACKIHLEIINLTDEDYWFSPSHFLAGGPVVYDTSGKRARSLNTGMGKMQYSSEYLLAKKNSRIYFDISDDSFSLYNLEKNKDYYFTLRYENLFSMNKKEGHKVFSGIKETNKVFFRICE